MERPAKHPRLSDDGPWSGLFSELVIAIAERLPCAGSVRSMSRVCRHWHESLTGTYKKGLWKVLAQRHFPLHRSCTDSYMDRLYRLARLMTETIGYFLDLDDPGEGKYYYVEFARIIEGLFIEKKIHYVDDRHWFDLFDYFSLEGVRYRRPIDMDDRVVGCHWNCVKVLHEYDARVTLYVLGKQRCGGMAGYYQRWATRNVPVSKCFIYESCQVSDDESETM